MNIEIRAAANQDDIESVRLLFKEYEKAIGVDLCFQGFADELAGLPGRYSSPEGVLLLAFVDSQLAGCVALRWFDHKTCFIKRLFVCRGFGVLAGGGNLLWP